MIRDSVALVSVGGEALRVVVFRAPSARHLLDHVSK